MKELDNNSVDAIVTDPPYELGFMGKKWDASGIAYNVELWKECLRVLKPGGHLLSFGGTRTYHRMAVAIEDVGFEIRDMLEWIYASGFPKSQNVGKAYDKKMGNEREVIDRRDVGHDIRSNAYKDANPERMITNITKGNSQWEGFGTALKPAHEPIVLARKPLSEKTIVENCMKHGTGALDIDGCRIPVDKNDINHRPNWENHTTQKKGKIYGKYNTRNPKTLTQGRFPANLLVTDDALNDGEMTKSGHLKAGHKRGDGTGNSFMAGGGIVKGDYGNDSGSKSRYFDIDVWAEKHGLIQCPKASKKERNAGCEGLEEKEQKITNQYGMPRDDGSIREIPKPRTNHHQPRTNHHPTVKPLHLMSWLIRLVSKDGDTVLDPFMGSGTTGVACKQLDRNFIGIELNEEYIVIAEKRISHQIIQKELF